MRGDASSAAGSLLGACGLLLAACGSAGDLPIYEVAKRPFRHQVTAEGYLKSAKVTQIGVPEEVEWAVRLGWLRGEGPVEEGEVVARFDGRQMENLLVDGRRDLESVGLKVEKTESELDAKTGEHRTDHLVADLELAHAQRFKKTDEDVFARREIIEDQIDETLAGERQRIARELQDTQASLGRTELELLEIERRKARLKIDKAETGLDALEVRAPHAGILTWSRDWRGEPPQIGSQMWRGHSIAELPDLSKMEAEVFVLEADAGGLEVGKRAEVVLEARPEEVFAATISNVGAVAQPRFRGSPVQYFTVTLEIANQGDLPQRPGQRVRARLVLEELDEALVVPRQAVFSADDESWVYVRGRHGFARRPVEVGTRTAGLVVVVRGLEPGERVALARPPVAADEEVDG